MGEAPREFEVEVLLEDTRWVRGLALRLVGDAHLADEIVQETWMAALQRPPRDHDRRRAWLSRVVRNLSARARRDRAVRQRHERLAARHEAWVPPEQLVEVAERQQLLVNLVVNLPEPYRSTVLRRYFLDLSCEEIARHEGVPAATVRTRSSRALAMLRDRLDAAHGGNRGAWSGPLAPLVTLATARETVNSGLLTGAWIVSAKKIGVAVTILFLLLATVTWVVTNWDDRDSEERARTGVASSPAGVEADHPAEGPSSGNDTPSGGSESSDLAVAPANLEPASDKTSSTDGDGFVVSGRLLVAGTETPVVGSFLTLESEDGSTDRVQLGKSDERGYFEGETLVPAGRWTLTVNSPHARWLGDRLPGSLPLRDLLVGTEDTTDLVVEHPWSAVLEGRVLDPSGAPIAAAEVRLVAFTRRGIVAWWEAFWLDDSPQTYGMPTTSTDGQGHFAFDGLPVDAPLCLIAKADGFSPRLGDSFRLEAPREFQSITLERPGALRGHVRLPDGSPVRGASVYASPTEGGPGFSALPRDHSFLRDAASARTRAITDDDGAFEISGVTPGEYFVRAHRSPLRQLPADRSADSVRVDRDQTVDVEVTLLPAHEESITGFVVDAAGNAVSNAVVLAIHKTEGAVGQAPVGSDGRFVLNNLPTGVVTIVASQLSHARFGVTTAGLEATAGDRDVELVFDVPTTSVRIDVREQEGGAPVRDTVVSIVWFSTETSELGGASMPVDSKGGIDPEFGPGEYHFFAATRTHQVGHIAIIAPETDLPERLAPQPITLRPGRTIWGRVIDSDGKSVPGASVGLFVNVPRNSDKLLCLRNTAAVTDDQGQFELHCLPEAGGLVGLVGQHFWYAPEHAQVAHDGMTLRSSAAAN